MPVSAYRCVQLKMFQGQKEAERFSSRNATLLSVQVARTLLHKLDLQVQVPPTPVSARLRSANRNRISVFRTVSDVLEN